MNIRTLLLRPRLAGALLISAFLAGCAGLQSHDQLASEVQSTSRNAGVGAALARLEASASSDEDRKALLYNLERGELLRLDGRYQDSTEAFLLADQRVREWEETAATNPSKLMGMAGASLVSERLKTFEGQDYEKVFLTTRLALNRVAVGDLENARVDIKRTHEREAVIAEFRAKETAAAEEEAQAKGATREGKEINGYPVETLNDPEVLALRNGYQNALSHYLAGFLYEVLNEPGLAAPGYRKAIELRPDTAVLEDGLRGLDQRTGFTWKRRQRMTDVLFIVEAGDAPARKPRSFTIPVPTGRSIIATSISYPVIEPSTDPLLTTLRASDAELRLERVVDVNVMARRALKDEMPGMVLRGVTRAVAKGVLQDQLQKNAGILGAVLGSVASMATEQADDRLWRMLPGRVYIARAYLPEGEQKVTIQGQDFNVKVGGQYALVPLRIFSREILVGDTGSFGQLAAAPAMATTTTAPIAATSKPAKAQPKARVKAKPVANPS